MDKKKEMVFNLNNFLLAFADFFDSKKRAYISLNIAIELNYDDRKLADITALALAYDLGLEALENFAFLDKNILKDKDILEIVDFSNKLVFNNEFNKNSINNKKEILEFIDKSSCNEDIKNVLIELISKVSFHLDLENSNEIVLFIYSKLNDFTTVLKFEDILKMSMKFNSFVEKDSKIVEKAELLANYFEFEHKDKELFKIASSLQNIGKLALCNDKNKNNFNIYPYYTKIALSQIMQFDDIVKLCKNVEERLDGSGLFNLEAKDLSFKDRLLISLVFYNNLLKEDLNHEEIISNMKKEAKLGKIDESIVDIFDKLFIN
ncbi:phosphohydrolase [Aliarcobacter thereius]|uniref:Phosphohydrolase n=1 Tax=Aliarcobacter thereius TaxID=544718 RepID=A0A5R9GZ05_9BACT|nr:HD domain-containing phosphohydrolase [Aliarcobacter thereius]TLS71565.1 phosphohydrolase [Aliarcobacter thereius]TLT06202.1 phosphohydrolase [Aliarcobacter thereius]